ncbi:P-loop containing nucleoside triphosphate hydrolase protein [Schizothecium vesticola]|uniref:P-loop containing nucleoside triphosphate hydrolase protein n=1 Tax=Schizothecium vesticola TaxID=314040 RepID=A0AA40F1I3_9PEZI|nr:P-loop containing nucleoside triphosphate hydrolase protein [Schizothecium vesticola]
MSVRNNPFARNASPSPSPGPVGPGRPKSTLFAPAPSPLAPSPMAAPSPPSHSRSHSHASPSSGPGPTQPLPLRSGHQRELSRSATTSTISSTFAPSFIKTEDMRKHSDLVKGIEGENDFSGKKYVWLKDPQAAFVKGWVVEELGGNRILVQCDDGSQRDVDAESVDKVNPAKFDKANDMAELTHLNEASVVHNLHMRYQSDLIYTYSGLFLVTVNPYCPLPIYTNEYINMYKGRNREDNKPHIYAMADEAFRNLVDENENQSILVTGESGAGKTENTKKVIQYLAAVAHSESPVKNRGHQHSNLSAQILRANPILEAFGNAQTVRNNNSSRFGKFIRIEFSHGGAIAGAFIDWYLLEKSRVVRINSNERNYHIFYQLLRGADRRLKQDFLLDGLDVEDFAYTRQGNDIIAGVSDREEWESLMEAFLIMGFSEKEQASILRTIAAVLHLGNINVVKESRSADQARLAPDAKSVAAKVCKLLGVPLEPFLQGLLHPKVKAGREWVEKVQTPEQVRLAIDALAKGVYERGFGDLVTRINRQLDRPSMGLDDTRFIGVLDIAGFEIFENNSFEQLCINYTNEKLQQFFNHHMFVLEQEEYAREQIEWQFIDFGKDLQPTIDLIELSNPIGIFSCLDEDSVMPKATDKTFTEKLNSLWDKKTQKYRPSRLGQGFILTHYAAEVEYSTDGWLEKNKDPLNDNITRLLATSTDKHVANLFVDCADQDDEVGGMRSRVKKGLFRTVAQRHKEQLSSLMAQLHSTHPHFVRCILPNHKKKPKQFNGLLVLDQLRCNGVLEGIRIARTGFPNRLPFAEFRQRYEVLCRDMPKGYLEGQAAARLMLDKFGLDRTLYRVGLTKVFFRAGVLAELEEQRDALITEIMSRFQSMARGYVQRRIAFKRLYRAEATRVIQRNFQVYLDLCQSPWWQLLMRMKPLLGATRTATESLKDEYDRLNESKIIIEKELYAQQDTLRRTMELRATAEKERDEARQEIKRLRIEKSQAEEARREAELVGERAASKIAREREESLRKDLDAAGDRLRWFEAECAKLNHQVEDLNKLILESGEFGLKNDQAKERLERELHTVKSRLAASENDNRALLNKIQQKGLEIARSSSRATEASRGQIQVLQREKARLEEQNAKLNKQLGDSQVTITSMEKKLEKLQLNLEDLNHEVAREVKSNRHAEKASSSFTAQLAEANRNVESERQLRTQAQGTVRSLQSALDSRDVELAELRTQLLNALRTVDPDAVPPAQNENGTDKALSKNFDLVRKIEDLQQNLRAQAAARTNAEAQLAELRATKNASPTRPRLEEINVNEAPFNGSPTQKRSKANARHYSNASTPPRRHGSNETDYHLQDSTRSDRTADILSFNNRMDLKTELEELQNQLQLAQMQNRHLQSQLERSAPSPEYSEETPSLKRVQKLEKANGRLHDMLDDSAKKVSALEKALRSGELSLRDIQTKSHEEILDTLNRQEDSRRSLLHSHKDTVAELSDLKEHFERIRHDRAKFEVDLRDARSDLQEMTLAREQEAASRSQLLQEFTDIQIRLDAETSKLADVTASLALYKSRSDEYFSKLEQAEIAVLKANRAEQFAKSQAKEAEESCAEMASERKRLDATIEDLQLQSQRLEEKLEDVSTDLDAATQAKKRLQHELEDYRNQRANDIEDKESNMEQMRRKYQAEFATITKELDLAREEKLFKQAEISRLRDELDELRSKWDDEVLNSSTWSKEKSRLEATLSDVVASRDEAVNAHNDAQSKIVSLLSQVRALRSSVDEATSERDLLLREKRGLEKRLEEAKAGLEELAKSESPSLRNAANIDREILELKAGLAQSEDIAAAAVEKMRRAEALVQEVQKDINAEREAGAELQKQKVALEKALNEVQLRLIDLETKGYSTASHDIKFLHKRIQELETQLEAQEDERNKSQRSVRNVDRTVKDLQSQIDRKEKQNNQLQEDVGRMRDKADKLLKTIDELQASESSNELTARRAERELREEREKSLRLERELEGWKNLRMEKGSALGNGSVAGSIMGGSLRSRDSMKMPVNWRGFGGAGEGEDVKIPRRKSSISRAPSLTKGFL